MASRPLNWKEKKRKSRVDTTLLHLLLPLSLPAGLRIAEPARHHYDHPSLALPLPLMSEHFTSLIFCPHTFSVSLFQFPSSTLQGAFFYQHIVVLLITSRGAGVEGAQRESCMQWGSRWKYDGEIAALKKVISKGSRKEKVYKMKWDGIHNWRSGRRETWAFFFFFFFFVLA